MSSLLPKSSSCLRVLLYITIIITISDAFQSRKLLSSSSSSSSIISANGSGTKTMSSVAFIQRSRSKNMLLLSIRGGGDDDDDDELEVSDDEDESEEEETDDEEESDDDDDEEEEETEDEDEESTPTLSTPVKITFSTSLYKPNPLIDQTVELTASPTRTVASLKLSISKQLKSKPPVQCIVLKLDGIILDDDDVVVAELVDEDEDDDDDEDEEEDDDDDDMPKLKIQVDIIPPVDPKFGTEMKERLDDMTNDQVLDAYVANVAALHQNSLDLIKAQSMLLSNSTKDDNDETEDEEDDEDEDEENENEDTTSTMIQSSFSSLDLQKNAIALKDQIMSSLSEKELELLKKSDTPSSPATEGDDSLTGGDMLLKESLKRKKKRRGGAAMNVKRSLQKNLNIVSFYYLFPWWLQIYSKQETNLYHLCIIHFVIHHSSSLYLFQKFRIGQIQFVISFYFSSLDTLEVVMLHHVPSCYLVHQHVS